jgi:hypothetical protein
MPYLVAALLAFVFRWQRTTLIVLEVLLSLGAFVGISITYSAVSQQTVAEQQVKDAVQPGEDPNHGPAAIIRKSGAEMGAAIGFGFLILLAVVIPAVQTAVIAIPTVIVGVISSARQGHLRPDG